MSEFNEFVYKEPRTLPVFLLLDTSGSMHANGNIDILNQSVQEMLHSFKGLDSTNAQIALSIITFGPDPNVVLELTPVSKIEGIKSFEAYGSTPLGGAIKILKKFIEDKNVVTSRTYKPVVVLVSDGMPNDLWKDPMNDFINNGRSSKCSRMALNIGADDNSEEYKMLSSFVSKNEKVYRADKAADIVHFFKYVTMSVSVKSKSDNPNKEPENLSSDDIFGDMDFD